MSGVMSADLTLEELTFVLGAVLDELENNLEALGEYESRLSLLEAEPEAFADLQVDRIVFLQKLGAKFWNVIVRGKWTADEILATGLTL